MLKDRIYYKDAYRQTFTSRILHTGTDEQGRPYAVLDNTAFYPTGGGQPHDTGTIDGIAVTDVEEFDGEIRHFLESALHSKDEVEGLIDWERRFDHMQQHAGQHILTAAFVELFGFPTISFHLGKGLVSIDLDVENISQQQLTAAENLANQIILENRPIETTFITEDELKNYNLRKQPSVTDEIRLVIIPEFDYNGCGGTHPDSTSEIGLLKIISTEKQKRKVRVQFACGNRILQQLHRKHEELSAASKLLSAPEDGIATAIEKLLESNRIAEKALVDAKENLLTYEAKELLAEQTDSIVKATFTHRTVQELQQLARLLVGEGNDSVIALLAAENEDKLQFVAARGVSATASMKMVSATVLPTINGKGGGNDTFVQGGGEKTISVVDLANLMESSILN
ncbi:alanine--tRNA ligase-related protein [Sporosarcina oncorhynchi]|uniref:Alanine--tRNA ligase-related protein n=1 Tax=Sporosarcina oncorhynchi TaxID=3056444 RepID=A0ABZ0L7V5_9BACL|nr:DHHA1 domain-containing protein [Sporosarcina sp. T2O-4]WOV87717.1 alanine--tRNA ligase-related protein [Sporosarcina sp. T2O-4]